MKEKIIITIFFVLSTIVGNAQNKGEKIWKEVVAGYANTPVIKVTSVAMFSDRTEVRLHIKHRKGFWIAISPNTIIKVDNTDYAVKEATKLKLGERFSMPEDTLNFVLTFEPIPTTTECLDIMEPGAWYVMNVRSKDFRPVGITNTYWRNDATGDWMVGFTPKHVIYGNQVIDIVGQTEKKDVYILILSNGRTIKIGKNKKGRRTVSVDNGHPVICSPIITNALFDYPIKDTRSGFIDTGYNTTDSVTVIGWLKDMPEQAWSQGKEFKAEYLNIISDKEESYYTKMDSLGRFNLKMPLINSSQVFLDWGRSTISTVLEPGKTYFLLNDFVTGQKLWMGDDVRVQNELLSFPHNWNNDRVGHEEMGKVHAMDFKTLTDKTRATSIVELEERLDKHPTLSQRYIDYLTGYYLTAQGESLMQARYNMPNYDLPKEYMDYVGMEIWSKAIKPYTLYRDFSVFMRDYLSQLTDNRNRNSSDRLIDVIQRLEHQELIKLSDGEKETLTAYFPILTKLETNLQDTNNGEKIQELVDAFNKNDTVIKTMALFDRIGDPLKKEIATFECQDYMHIIDSVGCDQNLRDIYLSRYLLRLLDLSRQPLDSAVIDFARREMKLSAALNYVIDQNDKYLAIQQRDIIGSQSLKPISDVANMSDGEQILRSIIDPYKGKLILLDIWGTWCGPCKEALSHSAEEYERLKEFDIIFLYLANRSNDESWKNIIKEYNVTGDNVVHYNLPVDQQSAIENYLQVNAFPTYKLIDREGNILDVNADPRNLESLARLLDNFR